MTKQEIKDMLPINDYIFDLDTLEQSINAVKTQLLKKESSNQDKYTALQNYKEILISQVLATQDQIQRYTNTRPPASPLVKAVHNFINYNKDSSNFDAIIQNDVLLWIDLFMDLKKDSPNVSEFCETVDRDMLMRYIMMFSR